MNHDRQASPRGPTSQVAMIACTKQKRLGRALAIELYDSSPLFCGSVDAARRDGLPILIISSKYGVVDSDELIDSYEADLKTMSGAEIRAWESLVASQVTTLVRERGIQKVVFLAGRDYRTPIEAIAARLGVSTAVHSEWQAICDRAFR